MSQTKEQHHDTLVRYMHQPDREQLSRPILPPEVEESARISDITDLSFHSQRAWIIDGMAPAALVDLVTNADDDELATLIRCLASDVVTMRQTYTEALDSERAASRRAYREGADLFRVGGGV